LYIGQASNIRKALLAYLSGGKLSVLEWQAKDFAFELVHYTKRLAMWRELVAHYQPVCNRKGSPRRRRLKSGLKNNTDFAAGSRQLWQARQVRLK
jgi:hypothetical protein